jgi:hypothetical protein
MAKDNCEKIWVAVRVQRGFVADVRAYRDLAAARRTIRRWRQRMNPDYDETGLSSVVLNPRRCPTSTT